MGKFKKGDKVKCSIGGGDRGCIMGLIGTVMCDDDSLPVSWKGLTSGHNFDDLSGWWVGDQFLTKCVQFKGNK